MSILIFPGNVSTECRGLIMYSDPADYAPKMTRELFQMAGHSQTQGFNRESLTPWMEMY